MTKPRVEHFDVQSLVQAVQEQRIGLRVSTNHPDGFRRVMYKYFRQTGQRLHILQNPESERMFELVKQDFELKEQAA